MLFFYVTKSHVHHFTVMKTTYNNGNKNAPVISLKMLYQYISLNVCFLKVSKAKCTVVEELPIDVCTLAYSVICLCQRNTLILQCTDMCDKMTINWTD